MTGVWSIGKAQRNVTVGKQAKIGKDFLAMGESPGPCAYNPRPRNKTPGPQWTMHGTNTRTFYRINRAPGPGTYELEWKVDIWTQ